MVLEHPYPYNVIPTDPVTRLSFKKGRANTRIAKIYDSPNLPEGQQQFAIGPDGINDPAEDAE